MADPVSLYDAHFIPLPSQGNVYSLAFLQDLSRGVTKVLVASLKRKVYSLEYVRDARYALQPTVSEIPFTYLPEGAEIISVDAFNKSENGDEMVVGLAIINDVERAEGKTSQYLNIYSDWEPEFGASPLEVLAQNWRHVELDFIPYQLQHVVADIDGVRDTVFLLSGSDRQMHLYCEDKPNQSFREMPLEGLFPELTDLPSVVLWTDFFKLLPGYRVTAIGCECGYVRVTVVELVTQRVTHSWSAAHDGPVTSVRLFTVATGLAPPAGVAALLPQSRPEQAAAAAPLHLLVTSALWPALVYAEVPLTAGAPPPRRHPLPLSDAHDVVTCSCVCDINMDSRNELLLGTYGQELLVYSLRDGEWRQLWRHSFSQPLLGVTYVDLLGDGIDELVVLTTHGLQVLQHDTREAALLLQRRLEALQRITGADLRTLAASTGTYASDGADDRSAATELESESVPEAEQLAVSADSAS